MVGVTNSCQSACAIKSGIEYVLIIFNTVSVAPAWQSYFVAEVSADPSSHLREWCRSNITSATNWKCRTFSWRGSAWPICSGKVSIKCRLNTSAQFRIFLQNIYSHELGSIYDVFRKKDILFSWKKHVTSFASSKEYEHDAWNDWKSRRNFSHFFWHHFCLIQVDGHKVTSLFCLLTVIPFQFLSCSFLCS